MEDVLFHPITHLNLTFFCDVDHLLCSKFTDGVSKNETTSHSDGTQAIYVYNPEVELLGKYNIFVMSKVREFASLDNVTLDLIW